MAVAESLAAGNACHRDQGRAVAGPRHCIAAGWWIEPGLDALVGALENASEVCRVTTLLPSVPTAATGCNATSRGRLSQGE